MNTMTTRFVKNLVMYHVPGTVLIIYNLLTFTTLVPSQDET